MNKRILSVLNNIKKSGLDAFLLSNSTNISYLTGFRLAEGCLLITERGLRYFTSFIYAKEAKKIKVWKVEEASSNLFSRIADKAKKLEVNNIGFEENHISYLEYRKLREIFLKKSIKLVPSYSIIEKSRAIKEKNEIKLIKKAINITLQALQFAKDIIRPGITEKHLQIEIERFLKLKGDDHLSFPPIVAFGKNTSIVHYISSSDTFSNRKPVLIDLGARCNGYCADLTRTFFLDKMPASLTKVYDIVKKSQELAIKKIKEGVKAKEVDRAARDFIDRKGFGKYFGHGLGHGVGIVVHEEPFINGRSNTILKSGMVITIEPGIYLPSKFGVRIEDMVLVRENKAEVLSADTNR